MGRLSKEGAGGYGRKPSFGRKRGNAAMRLIPWALMVLLLALVWVAPLAADGLKDSVAHSGRNASATAVEAIDGGSAYGGVLVSEGEVDDESGLISDNTVVINSSIGGVDAGESDEGNAAAVQSGSPAAAAGASDGGFDFSRWGYASYEAYVTEHPVWARIHYAELWLVHALTTVQPVGCSGCMRQPAGEGEGAGQVALPHPANGYVFESDGEGLLPQLTVVAPPDRDAYVKLRDTVTGSTVLSFYVRAGSTVKACVSEGTCDLYYALGVDWFGPDDAFGEDGVYAVSDKQLSFSDSGNSYTYTFEAEDGNVAPRPISREDFC